MVYEPQKKYGDNQPKQMSHWYYSREQKKKKRWKPTITLSWHYSPQKKKIEVSIYLY
jgi:hypothetical protein